MIGKKNKISNYVLLTIGPSSSMYVLLWCVCVCMCVLEQVASTEADLAGLKHQLGVFMGRMDKEICSKADIQALQVRWLGSFY